MNYAKIRREASPHLENSHLLLLSFTPGISSIALPFLLVLVEEGHFLSLESVRCPVCKCRRRSLGGSGPISASDLHGDWVKTLLIFLKFD